MNHENLTKLARLIEAEFPTSESVQSQKDHINETIRFVATHLPILTSKSKPEEFMELDAIGKSIRGLSRLEQILDKLQDVVHDNR
jgi:hypothetical protein